MKKLGYLALIMVGIVGITRFINGIRWNQKWDKIQEINNKFSQKHDELFSKFSDSGFKDLNILHDMYENHKAWFSAAGNHFNHSFEEYKEHYTTLS